MKHRCYNSYGSDAFYQTDRILVKEDLMEHLVTEVILKLEENDSIPLLADWATYELQCPNECIEECTVLVKPDYLAHYVSIIGGLILACSLAVYIMQKWERSWKKRKDR